MDCAHRILLAAILAVFYVLEALAVRNVANDAVKAAYVIWPREGWAFGMGAAVLWLLISFFCCCASSCPPLHEPYGFCHTLRVIKASAAQAPIWHGRCSALASHQLLLLLCVSPLHKRLPPCLKSWPDIERAQGLCGTGTPSIYHAVWHSARSCALVMAESTE